MKHTLIMLAALFWGVTLFAQAGGIQVTITGITPEWGGTIRVGLYSEADFPKEGQSLFSQIIPVRSLEQQVIFLEIAAGTYAIALFQDINSDGKLNRTFYGAPTEPYAFSNNVFGRFGPPKFADVAITVFGGESLGLNIRLE